MYQHMTETPEGVFHHRELPFDVFAGEVSNKTSKAVLMFYTQFMAWDMSVIKQYMVANAIYTAEEIDGAEAEYKKWLALAVAYMPRSVPISAKVDKFWHTHILFTQDYTAMSKSIAGEYIHHRPSILDSARELEGAFSENTLALYYQYFGRPNPMFWDSVMCTCQIGE